MSKVSGIHVSGYGPDGPISETWDEEEYHDGSFDMDELVETYASQNVEKITIEITFE